MKILQGDSFYIPFEITVDGVEQVTEDDIEKVEIAVGDLVKYYPEEISFMDGRFLFHLSQEETFSMSEGPLEVQVRVKFATGNTVGQKVGPIDVRKSITSEVL